jgi:hypothetical protein
MTNASGTTYNLSLAADSIIADGKHVPQDPANRDWQLKLQDDAAAGGSAEVGAALEPEIDVAIVNAKRLVERQAEARMVLHLPAGPAHQSHYVLRFEEAKAADADGSPAPEEYLLLAAEVDETGADIAAVADAVLAEVAALKASWKPIVEVAMAAKKQLDACETHEQIAAVLDAVVWPS